MKDQDKFKCKHIECDMDGCYCGIKRGEGYNHCVLPYYKDECEYFEDETSDLKDIIKQIIDERCEAELGQVHASSKNGKVTKTVDTSLIAKDICDYLNDPTCGLQKVEPHQIVIDKDEYERLNSTVNVIKVKKGVAKDHVVISKEEYTRLKIYEVDHHIIPEYMSIEAIEKPILEKYNRKIKEHCEQHHDELKKEVAKEIYDQLQGHGTTYVKKWINKRFDLGIKE